jgi:hypothetical protein
MEIYIQSCGSAVEQDYSWQIISEDKPHKVETPSIIKWINQFVQKDAPSVFIGRKTDQLILFISNLESANRLDHVRRKARNSILCITKKFEEESLIRSVAARALAKVDLFATETDKIISFSSNSNGFNVDHQEFQKLLKEELSNTKQLSTLTDCRIGKNSLRLRAELAEELLQHQLPQKEGVLVVVTQFQDPKLFKENKVWRGLSALCPKESWESSSSKNYLYFGLAAGLIGILALILGLLLIRIFSVAVKPGNYLVILENKEENVILYNEPDTNSKDTHKVEPGTEIKIIKKQEKWFKIKICDSLKSEATLAKNADLFRWIPASILENEHKENYQKIDKPTNVC